VNAFLYCEDPPSGPAVKEPSEWGVMARLPQDLEGLLAKQRWKPLSPQPGLRVWTDDFSNISSVLRLR
jgi:hypothetical protein